jgi:hypothetical protein
MVESMLTQRAPLVLEELREIRASSPTGSPKFSSAAAFASALRDLHGATLHDRFSTVIVASLTPDGRPGPPQLERAISNAECIAHKVVRKKAEFQLLAV